MCRLVQLAVAIFVALWSFIAHSAVQAQNESIKLFDKEFHERFDERGRVSGDIVMGVMIGPAPPEEKDDEEGEEDFVLADLAPRQSADVAVTHLPKNVPASARSTDNAPLFCVRINSKDGRFEAENTYEVTDSATIPDTPFPYGGSHAPVVKSMRAVSLVKTGRCGNRTEEVVPSVWAGTDPGDGPRALHVFVNSAGNPTVAVVGSDIGFVPCENVADASTLKYTASCILPFEMLEAHKQGDGVPVTFFITRSLGEEDFNIVVKLPGGDS